MGNFPHKNRFPKRDVIFKGQYVIFLKKGFGMIIHCFGKGYDSDGFLKFRGLPFFTRGRG